LPQDVSIVIVNKLIQEQRMIGIYLAKWLIIGSAIGILAGTSSATLLTALEWATIGRESHPWLIWLLPLGGFLSGLIYHHWGSSVEAGNNLLLAEIHDPTSTIPLRMAPMVLLGTTISHLFGGSAGREGSALQMSAAIADRLTSTLRLSPIVGVASPTENRSILLTAAISSGFASVFGTPLAGMLFGLEVTKPPAFQHSLSPLTPHPSSLTPEKLFPCAIAAIVGDRITLAWGLEHTSYQIPIVPKLTPQGILSAIIAGLIFGITARVFVVTTQAIGNYFKAKIAYPPFRPAIGGVLVTIATEIVGNTKYIGLGIPTIVSAFHTQLPPWDFVAKIGFTALTIGSGFKGGEVTPLFYIGATLGNALSSILQLPAPLLAGMGFVGVFAGAANTPLASILMAIELFGAPIGIYAAIACICSYLGSGHTSIYRAQKIGSSKIDPIQK
jgi:H+/Cl- antiporter ClcA